MPSLVEKLIQQQHRIEDSIPSFVDSLNRSNTVTLPELLTDGPFRSVSWVDTAQLARRLENAMWFFRGVSPRIPLVFFQIPNVSEHRSAHERMAALMPRYRDRYGKVGHEAHFLPHTTMLWSTRLTGENGSGERRIRPCSSFKSEDWNSLGVGPLPGRACPQVLGFWLPPDYPRMLGVSPAVATDCLASRLLHDMGHFVLPEVATSREPLYQVTMVAAMSVFPGEVKTMNAWERAVHEHATEPYFFLYALELLKSDHAVSLTPLQSWLRDELRTYYASIGRLRRELWGIPGKRRLHRARWQVKERIEDMWYSNFDGRFA